MADSDVDSCDPDGARDSDSSHRSASDDSVGHMELPDALGAHVNQLHPYHQEYEDWRVKQK